MCVFREKVVIILFQPPVLEELNLSPSPRLLLTQLCLSSSFCMLVLVLVICMQQAPAVCNFNVHCFVVFFPWILLPLDALDLSIQTALGDASCTPAFHQEHSLTYCCRVLHCSISVLLFFFRAPLVS